MSCSKTSDVVSLHCPLTPETRHLINADRLGRMRPDAYLVNTARGPIVDEAALVVGAARRLHRRRGARCVRERARCPPRSAGLDNVVLTPHLGSATTETRTEMALLAVRNALAVARGDDALTPSRPSLCDPAP